MRERQAAGTIAAVGALLLAVLVLATLTGRPRGADPGSETPSATAAAQPSAGATASPATGSPPQSEPPDVILVGAGDIGSCSSEGDEATAALLDEIPGVVFTLGDNAYEDGAAEEFATCYEPSWGRHKGRTRPVAGNHDHRTDEAQGMRDYFGLDGPTYYAYDVGEWRIYVIDSNCALVGGCGPGSHQYEWLAADLAAEPRQCAAAMWHHPKFTIGPHDNDEGESGILWELLHARGVDLVLNGHDHNYQRWTPMRPDGTPDPAGIRLIINGAGGKNHTTPTRDDPRVEARNHDTFGVLKLTLAPEAYAWEFIPEAGKTFTDSGSADCH